MTVWGMNISRVSERTQGIASAICARRHARGSPDIAPSGGIARPISPRKQHINFRPPPSPTVRMSSASEKNPGSVSPRGRESESRGRAGNLNLRAQHKHSQALRRFVRDVGGEQGGVFVPLRIAAAQDEVRQHSPLRVAIRRALPSAVLRQGGNIGAELPLHERGGVRAGKSKRGQIRNGRENRAVCVILCSHD